MSSNATNDFEGKVAVITGAASGIGRAAAMAFAKRRAAVVLADIDEAGAASLAREIEQGGGRAVSLRTDVAVPEDCAAMVALALGRFGRLDVAFNNAGVADHDDTKRTADQSVEIWRRTIEVCLSSMFYCMKAEIPALLAQGGGAIVNTSSVAGLISFPHSPAYIAAKHGIIGLTKAVCNEYASEGIRCNAVAPGFTETPAFAASLAANPAQLAGIESTVPAMRLGKPEEIAEAVVWLASPAASYVNGACLAIDGGFVVR
jgi:NAD(P)-dependent dehydrogenase (short-subunit alcohol dehydrogenase family)